MKLITGRLRAVAKLLSLVFRTDRRRTILALVPIIPVASGLSYVSARGLLRALPRDDVRAVVVAAVIFTVAFALTVWLGRVVRTTRIQLGELGILSFNRRLLASVVSPHGLEPIERSSYLDRIATLRGRVFDIGQGPRMLGWLVDSGGGLVVAAALLVSVHPVLALAVLGGVPSAVVNGWAQRRIEKAREADAVRVRSASHLYELATDPAAGKEVRVYGLGDELVGRFEKEWRVSDRVLRRAEFQAAAIQIAGWLVQSIVFGLGVLWLVGGAEDGVFGPGEMFLGLGAMALIVGQFGQAAGGLTSIGRSSRLFEHLEALEAIAHPVNGSAAVDLPERLTSNIALDCVTFRYEASTTEALKDVSVVFPAGSVVAVVGDNGAGKSTLVKLLFALYRPSSGRILIDESELGDMGIDAWRRRTSACFQDYMKFELVTRESIGVGELQAIDDTEHVQRAVQSAASTDVIDLLPDGLETQLGPRFGGVDLSGGQWQKIAISRAMMRETPLLLALDEPTSALDPLAEQELFATYASAAKALGRRNGAVTILVSHRFSTVRMADVIIVLEAGRVVESGSHSELIANGGLYAEMYEMQARHYR